jgi:hypothetical protein
LAKQTWFKTSAQEVSGPTWLPVFEQEVEKAKLQQVSNLIPQHKQLLLERMDRVLAGAVFVSGAAVQNVHLSVCCNCNEAAVWVRENLLFPNFKTGPQPNKDLSADIQKDFNEAREIVNASPRGAAALLRLCIQKLCKQLGEKGENINADIASLVKKGLNPRVQKSLDIVRVIGNEAVHPGTIDTDNRAMAMSLFALVNSIADQMISQPKHVDALYEGLPKDKRDAIESRDKK